jgi:hypothetical protein
MLLKKQKPIDWSRVAWWPGGRTAQKALLARPDSTSSVAATAAPAEASAACSVPAATTVSGSTARVSPVSRARCITSMISST